MNNTSNIPGYSYGSRALARSPIAIADFELMKKTAAFGDEDVTYLRLSHDVLRDQVDAVLDVWYGFVGSNPHLLATFTGRDGAPVGDNLAAVRARFGRWILDTARAEYDQAWLDYQHEIGLRHHRSRKNQTDRVEAADIVPFRYLLPLVYPITATLRPFLAKKEHTADEIDKMQAAWVKSCLLQVALWSRPYVREGDY